MLTKKKLRKIKESIVDEKRLLTGNGCEVKELSTKTYEHLNCYSYALGIMYPSKNRIYTPGFTTKENYIEDSKISLISKICEDLDNLEISYRKFGVYDEINLIEGEYLIQVMYVPCYCDLWIESDFHFSRRSKDGFWFSKQGWLNQPSSEYIEVLEKEDDEEIVRVHSDNCVRSYVRIGYFAIKEKK